MKEIGLSSHNNERKENLHNPIISLVNDQDMMWEEKTHLSTTGLNNPMKVENTEQNQKVITELVDNLSDGTYLKFSSIQAIQEGMVDTYRDSVRNLTFFCLICSSRYDCLLLTTFLLKRRISLPRSLWGCWSILPSSLSSALAGLCLPLLVLIFFAHALLPLLLFAGFTCWIYYLARWKQRLGWRKEYSKKSY